MAEVLKASSLALTFLDMVIAQEGVVIGDKQFSSFCGLLEYIDSARNTLTQDEYREVRDTACRCMAELRALSDEGFAVFCDLFHEDSDWNHFKRIMEIQIKRRKTTARIAAACRNCRALKNAQDNVALIWGEIGGKVIAGRGQTFVRSIYTIALRHTQWSEAVHHFNQAIFRRITIRTAGRCSSVKLQFSDVQYVTRNLVGTTPKPLTEKQLRSVGCGLDKIGLLKQERKFVNNSKLAQREVSRTPPPLFAP
ncbi:hypothetical protein AJ78_08065 [Emergomyces pasteurianus Ep9510]|uniref:Uncharacterized protein n=1 Tax=Emergomyces pasteurianus Ep9510 TaxID=1447872 RepID=A0A1J9P4M5_9EURO|nr:hypothetical protein AJ78_08065 [Emergomyces pasteurianus Ep9510]